MYFYMYHSCLLFSRILHVIHLLRLAVSNHRAEVVYDGANMADIK